MNFRPVAVQELGRSQHAWTLEVALGRRHFRSPAGFVYLEKPAEVELLTESGLLEGHAPGLVTGFTRHQILPPAAQTPLPGLQIQSQYDILRQSSPTIFDPETELLRNGEQPLRADFRRLPNLPEEFLRLTRADEPDYLRPWRSLSRREALLRVQRWAAQLQQDWRADVALPFGPHIDGREPEAADLARQCNEKMRASIDKTRKLGAATFYSLHDRAFRKPEITATILDDIREDQESDNPNRALIIKIESDARNDPMINVGAKAFFLEVNQLKRAAAENSEPFVVIAGVEKRGPSLVFAGVDAWYERFRPGGHKRGGSGVTPMGKYYHPGDWFRDLIPYDDIKQIFEELGNVMPCDCRACQALAGEEFPLPGDHDGWNTIRKPHFINARLRECDLFREAILRGNDRDGLDWVARGCNAQFAHWLPWV